MTPPYLEFADFQAGVQTSLDLYNWFVLFAKRPFLSLLISPVNYIAFLLAHILWATLLRITCKLIAVRPPYKALLEERPVERYSEVEEYGCQDEVDEYYHSNDADTPDEAEQQYVDYGKVPLPYDAEQDYADAILGRTRTHLEERVHPTPRKQKKRKTRAVKKKAVKRPTAKSPPTWESRYIRRFGKTRLQMLRNGGIPDYMIEEELLPPKQPTTTPYDHDEERRFHNEWTGPETFARPAAEPASWRGPNTFSTPAYQAAPADPTPASWGSAEADAAQESRAAENTGWFAYQSNPNAMDIGRMRLRAQAKCHHCWRTGHTRCNCPFRDEPRRRSWMADYNNDCDDPMPQAVPPRADNRMPRADPPQAAPPRGRSPTVKPVYGSNVATYAPTTRYEPTVITVPETQRRAPTPSPSPISDAGFKQIQHHVISTDQGTYKVPLLSPDDLAEALEDTHIHAVQAAEEGQYLRRQGQLQKLEDQLGDALIIGDDEEAQRLDDKAIRLAKVLAATDEDCDKVLPINDTDILIQRGRCSRREGNVTFSPSPDPRTPLAKTPDTVGRHMQVRFGKDGRTTTKIMHCTPTAKSHDSGHVIIQANKTYEKGPDELVPGPASTASCLMTQFADFQAGVQTSLDLYNWFVLFAKRPFLSLLISPVNYIAFLLAHILWATLLRITCKLIAVRPPYKTLLEERPVERYSGGGVRVSLFDMNGDGDERGGHTCPAPPLRAYRQGAKGGGAPRCG
ncbi:hypothetical protein EDB86DRAFT_2835001 [Lactarius hatsudake]|nr:hypothetical protein EDB86DRAFT_2835001 [Lactarius hatsudake]